jgi:hypothetical protein
VKYNQPWLISDPNAPFINGDSSIGREGSIPPAEALEYPQRELVNLFTDAGLVTPSNSDLHQLSRSIQSNLLNSRDDGGTANAYAVTLVPAPTAYYRYLTVVALIANTNTGPSTLSVTPLPPAPITHADGSPIGGGELLAGQIACFAYDGAKWQLVWTGGRVAGMPIYLTSARDYYVDFAAGDDTWDGTHAALVSGTTGPFKTCGRAAAEVNKFNLNGFGINVHVADNLNYPSFTLPNAAGAGIVQWIGNTAVPGNVTITGTNRTACSQYGICGTLQTMNGFKFSSVGSQSVNLDTCNDFGFGGGANVRLYNIDANIALLGAHRIVGDSPGGTLLGGGFILLSAAAGLAIDSLNPPSLAIPAAVNTPIFIQAANVAQASLRFSSITGAGNVTGKKFDVSANAIIDSGGNGISYFPGTIAGTQTTGGQYTS